MDKYIRLKFTDAGIFKNHGKCRDKSFDLLASSHMKRSDMKQFAEPITVHQISNALHVLFGQRPVPTLRVVAYDKLQSLFDKANDSYLKINTPTYKTKAGVERRIGELISTNKAAWNSFNPVVSLNWHKVELFLEDHYDDFVEIVVKQFGKTITSERFIAVAEMIKENCGEELTAYFEKLKTLKKKPLWDYIFSEKDVANINKNKRVLGTVQNGIDTIYRMSGEMLVPVSEDDLKVLSDNSGCATFLDGGYLTIDAVLDANRLSTYGFTKVSDISTKMI